MQALGNGFDGTLKKAIETSKLASGKPKLLQDYMLAGDFETGISKKADLKNIPYNKADANFQDFAAQLAILDKSSQRVLFKATKLNDNVEDLTQELLDATAAGKQMNSVLFEQTATSYQAKDEDVAKLMDIGFMKKSGKYALPDFDAAVQQINGWAAANKNADAVQRLLNAGVLELGQNGLPQLSAAFMKDVVAKNKDIAATKEQITNQVFLNNVLQIGKQLLTSFAISALIWGAQAIYKNLTEIDEKISEIASDSKEQAETLTKTRTSLSDIVKRYDEIGSKTTRTAEDTEELKSLQEELTELLKDQPGIGDNMLKKVNLQNASYETQLQLLKDIEKQQRQNAAIDLEDNVEDQGNLLVEAFKKKGQGLSLGSDATSTEIARALATDGFGEFSEDSSYFKFNNIDSKDSEAIAELYNDLNNEIQKLSETYSSEDLSVLKTWRKTLKQYVTNYNEAIDQLHDNNLPDVTNDALEKLQRQKDLVEKASQPAKTPDFDKQVKGTEQYQTALQNLQKVQNEVTEAGNAQYGNVNNLNRGKLVWNNESRNKYSDFAEENPDEVQDGNYSTILGSYDTVDGRAIAFTPMLQLDDNTLVPLTEDQLWDYLDDLISQCEGEDGTIDFDELLKLDATGLKKQIGEEVLQVKGMIAGIEGIEENGKVLTKADVMARSGSGSQEITGAYLNDSKLDLPQNISVDYTLDSERNPGDITSSYVGNSMHDIQAQVTKARDAVANTYDELKGDAEDAYQAAADASQKATDKQISDYQNIENAVKTLSNGRASFDTSELTSLLTGDTSSLGEGPAQAVEKLQKIMGRMEFDPQNSEDVAAFVDILKQLGVVAPSAAEKSQDLAQRTKDAATQMSEAASSATDLQKAYQSCKSAVEEYNKTGYVSFSTLQSLTAMEPKYLSMLENSNGKLEINTATTKKLTQAMIEAQKAAILAQTLTDIENTTTLETAKEFLGSAQATVNDAKSLMLAKEIDSGRQAYEEGGMEAYDAVRRANAQRRKNAEMLMALWDDLGKQDPDDILGKDDKSSKSSKTQKTALDAWSTLSSAMKEYNQQGYITMQTLKSLTDLEDKYNSMLVKNDTTGKLEMSTDAFYDLMKAELKEAQIKGDGASEKRYNEILAWTDRNIKNQTMSYWDLVAAIEGYSTALSQAKEITDDFKDAWDNGKTVKQKTEKSRTGALDYEGTEAQSSALQDLLKYSEYDPTLIEKAYNKETGKIDLSGDMLKTAVVKSLEAQADAAETEGGDAAAAIAQSYRTAAKNINEDVISVQDYFDGLGATVDEINEKIDDMQSAWTDLNDVVNEYNTYDGLSVDTLQKLITMSPEYLACLQLEGGQLSVNADLMKDMLIKQLETKADLLESKDETRDQAKILREMIAQLEKNGISALSGLDQYAKNLEDTLSNIKSLFSDLLGVFEQFNTDKSNDLKIQGDAWLEVIDKRIDALNEQSDAQERAIELQKAQDTLDKAKANKTVHVYHAGGSGFEWESDQNAVRDAQSTLNDTIRKNRKEDELDRLNKLKEAVQKNNELIGSSFEDYEKKKKYLAEFDKMTYDEMIKYNDEWKDSILGNMKSAQAVTNVNDTITKIEKLISTLETLNNVLKALDTGFASTDGGGLTGLFSNGGILSKVGKFFNIASEDGLGAAINKTGEWFTGKVTAALEANPNNPIIKAFSNIWTKVGEGAGAFFNGSGSTGLGGIIKEGLKKIGGLTGSEGFLGQIVTKGGDLLAKIGVGGGATATTSAIPVIGPIIAVAVNNAVQQFGKISKENTKIWADQNSSTGEKIVKSVGNVLYHLSPVEGWDKSLQYAKVAAEGDNIWDKFKNGAKSLYYGCGLGVVVDNIFSTVKSILGVFGIKFKDNNSSESDNSTNSSTEKKKWYESKIFFWNWGKKAKGDKKIRNAGPYNVDEQGEEIIVHKPQTGRMTYLEKGDGVVPANETANLMAIGKNPTGWASGIFNNLLGSKLFGIADLIQKAIANDAKKTFKEFGKGTSSDISDLVDKAKEKTLAQIRDMTDAMSDAWKSVADETGVSQDKIEATSSEIFNRMQKLAEQTYSAINDNAGMSAEQVETVSEQLFEALQSIYTSGWNDIYATSDKMSEETASLLNSAYSGSAASCKKSMSSISSILKSSWSKCGGGTKNLANNTYKTLSKAWADTSQDAQKMMYDVRACFDTSWGAVEQGTSDLANGTESTLTDAWTSISSKSSEVFGPNGSLQRDADKSWSNVDPGATNLSDNMAWVMDQSYKSMKSGCAEAIDDVKQQVNAAADEFKATASQTENQTTEPAKEPEVKKEPEKKKNIIEKAWDATVDAVEYVANSVSDFFSGLFGHASGLKSASSSHFANVDELGPELLVRKPQSGRYTYLETGDGVVPADITSRLFEMGGNPDRWFQNQMSKYGSQSIAAKSTGSMSFSTGDIIIQNPVGSANDLASEIKREMPNKMAQEWNKR